MNGDGRNDVAMVTADCCDTVYKVHVLPQNELGQLDPQDRYEFSIDLDPCQSPSSMDVGDVNHDGRVDIVVGNIGNQSNVKVFHQDVSGHFTAGVSYPNALAHSIRIGDLNDDGLLDVAGVSWSGNLLDVLYQNMSGNLDPPVRYSSSQGAYKQVSIGDVNNDGLKDVITLSGRGFSTFVQRSGGTFDVFYYTACGTELAAAVVVGDVNGDGLEDVVAACGGSQPLSTIAVVLQNTLGTLDPPSTYLSYDHPDAVAVADVNNDGKKDIVVAHGSGYKLGIYLQGPGGILLPEAIYSLSSASYLDNPQCLTAGDINGDGINDILVGTRYSGLVVLYGRKSEPDILAHPSPLEFWQTYVGQTLSLYLTISNQGLSDLNMGAVDLTGANAAEFRIDANNCSGRTLMTSDRCTVTVIFAPESVGVKDAVLTVNSNDSNEPNVQIKVSGTGVTPPDIRQPISSIEFGDVNVGSFVDRTTTIFNDGGQILYVNITQSSGVPEFYYTGPSWFTISAGGYQDIAVRFSPLSAGAKGTTFTVVSNDPNEGSVQFTVSGSGVFTPDIRQPISSIDFGNVNAGVSLDQITTLYNDGSATLTIHSITRVSGNDEFVYIGPVTPFDIPAGGSQTITIRFLPTSGGPKSTTFTVTSNDPDESSVSFAVSGTGVTIPDIRQPIASINFGNVPAGSFLDRTTTLYNDGTGALTISSVTRFSGSTEFVFVGPPTPLDIPAGGSQTITIRFSPTSAGANGAIFNVNSNDPDEGNASFHVSGNQTSMASYTINPKAPYSYISGENLIIVADLEGDGDSGYYDLPLGDFDFHFYGELVSIARISTNGYITFSSNGSSHSNAQIPDLTIPNAVIAPFWDDLDLTGLTGDRGIRWGILGTSPNRQLVIEWYQVPSHEYGTETYSFEVILYESTHRIKFQYLDVESGTGHDFGASATVGIEDFDGITGYPFSYNEPSLHNGMAIEFIPFVNIFLDIASGHWAEEFIVAIYNAGITQGCAVDAYCPSSPVTREQMASFIVRAMDGTDAPQCVGNVFTDVPFGPPHCANIERLKALNITQGCETNLYCPQGNVTREQMAAFIVRALEGEPPSDYCDTGLGFTDVETTSAFCKYIKRLSELNITQGCTPGMYCPANNVLRDQMAAFLARAFLGTQ